MQRRPSGEATPRSVDISGSVGQQCKGSEPQAKEWRKRAKAKFRVKNVLHRTLTIHRLNVSLFSLMLMVDRRQMSLLGLVLMIDGLNMSLLGLVLMIHRLNVGLFGLVLVVHRLNVSLLGLMHVGFGRMVRLRMIRSCLNIRFLVMCQRDSMCLLGLEAASLSVADLHTG